MSSSPHIDKWYYYLCGHLVPSPYGSRRAQFFKVLVLVGLGWNGFSWNASNKLIIMSCTPNLVRNKEHSVTSFDNNYFNISRGEKFNKGHKGSSGYVYQVVANNESNDMKRLFAIRLNQTLQKLLLSFLKLPIMLSRTQQVPFFLQSKHSYIFFTVIQLSNGCAWRLQDSSGPK